MADLTADDVKRLREIIDCIRRDRSNLGELHDHLGADDVAALLDAWESLQEESRNVNRLHEAGTGDRQGVRRRPRRSGEAAQGVGGDSR